MNVSNRTPINIGNACVVTQGGMSMDNYDLARWLFYEEMTAVKNKVLVCYVKVIKLDDMLPKIALEANEKKIEANEKKIEANEKKIEAIKKQLEAIKKQKKAKKKKLEATELEDVYKMLEDADKMY